MGKKLFGSSHPSVKLLNQQDVRRLVAKREEQENGEVDAEISDLHPNVDKDEDEAP